MMAKPRKPRMRPRSSFIITGLRRKARKSPIVSTPTASSGAIASSAGQKPNASSAARFSAVKSQAVNTVHSSCAKITTASTSRSDILPSTPAMISKTAASPLMLRLPMRAA